MNPNSAWVGGININPCLCTPQELAAAGYHLNQTQLEKTWSDNGDWYQWNEPTDKDYDWLMVLYKDPDPSSATSNWEVAIDHDSNSVHLFYWHNNNESWVWAAQNDGGRDPGIEHTNVLPAFENNGGAGNVFLLFVGYTPAAGDDWIKCDVADITYN